MMFPDGEDDVITSLNFSPDSSKLMATGPNRVFIWNTNNGKMLFRFGFEKISSAAFSPIDNLIAVGTDNGEVFELDTSENFNIIWIDGNTVSGISDTDSSDSTEIGTYVKSKEAVRSVAFFENGKKVFAGTYNGDVMQQGYFDLYKIFGGHKKSIQKMLQLDDGRLVTSDCLSNFRYWNLEKHEFSGMNIKQFREVGCSTIEKYLKFHPDAVQVRDICKK